MKKLLCLLLQAALTATLSAQVINLDATTTRAVVVGISDYQDEKIPDLRFADRDAEAFVAWLESPAGGNVPMQNIHLITNQKATGGAVNMELWWLLQQSKEDDRAIIYFSGHGDMEAKMLNQLGFLLCWDSQSFAYFSGGSIQVTNLQEIVNTLTQVNKTQVLLITDACRAGKLAGSSINGTGATTANLQQFANAIKILSCQPTEFSLEGEQWGGGRGAFSYHLVDGLYGLADSDKDHQIKLKEISRYLEDHVPVDANPHVQNPLIIGDREALLARVDEGMLAQIESEKKHQQTQFSSGDMRGVEDLIVAHEDTNIQQIYAAYTAAVEAGNLMSPKGSSANDYYDILIHEPSIEQMYGMLTRNFVAALVDEAQQVTNKLLNTDPVAVGDITSRSYLFDHIPTYLEKATEILGEKHFLYKHLKAKQRFFEGKTCQPEKYPELSADSLVRLEVQKYKEALEFDSLAVYAHVELGFLYYYRLAFGELAWHHAKMALEFSPNWTYALYLAGLCKRGLDPEQGPSYLLKAIENDSTFLLPYQELYMIYMLTGEKEQFKIYLDKFIQKAGDMIALDSMEVPAYYVTLLGGSLYWAERYSEAEQVLKKAERLTKGKDWVVYQYLASVYSKLGECDKAKAAIMRQIEFAPNNIVALLAVLDCYKKYNLIQERTQTLKEVVSMLGRDNFHLGFLLDKLGESYRETGHHEESKATFQKLTLIFADPESPYEMNYKGRGWLRLGDLEAMQNTIDEGLKKFPGDVMVYYQTACLYSLAKDEQKSLEWLELAQEKGFGDYGLISTDPDLDNIRNSEGYNALVKKYFPEQFKD